MGNSPSKNTSNASPNTHASNSLNSGTGATLVAPSEPEPDDRKFPSLINNQRTGSAPMQHSTSQTGSLSGKSATASKYKDKKIQERIPKTERPHFTYYSEFNDDEYLVNDDTFELETDISLNKVYGKSPISDKSKSPLSSTPHPIITSQGKPVTAVVNTSVNGNIDTEVSSSFSDLFTMNSSSNSSLSISPPVNNLPPIIEEGYKKKTYTSTPSKSSKKRTTSSSFDIDSIIDRLLSVNSSSPVLFGKNSPVNSYIPSTSSNEFVISTKEISVICSKAREIFLNQPTLLKLQAPVKVVGDIHGQFNDLIRILKLSGFPPHSNYLFLGDYVDRGKQSLETILLLFCFKIKYPDNFFMLRGNHESSNVSKIYGFYDECKRRLNVKSWKLFVDVFNTLPIAGVINEKIFCVHGGLSPNLRDLKQIENIHRPTDIPESGLLADLLWSDPDGSLTDWSESDRGVSYCFGKKIVENFNKKFNFDLIIRGHMVVEDGYEFFAKKKLVTVFSAPNYCGEFNNWGAVMSVDNGLLCSFELLKPNKKLLNPSI